MLDQCQKQEKELEVLGKRIKLENKQNYRNETNDGLPTVWLGLNKARITLYSSDKETILWGERLNDIHILFAQSLLRTNYVALLKVSSYIW